MVETEIQVSGDGLFILAAKAWSLGGGLYQYEYALYNMNSDRAADGFTVPLPTDLCIEELGDIESSAGFHDIHYHSGEEASIDGSDWEASAEAGSLTWTLQSGSTNALRWGTLYNFRFQALRAPNNPSTNPIDVTVDLFKSGSPSNVQGESLAPVAATSSHRVCCYDGDSCTVTTACYCDDLSGIFLTAYTSCATSPCAMDP